MTLEQKLDYNYRVLDEMGKCFDFLRVEKSREREYPGCSQGIAVNRFHYDVEVYIPVKRKTHLPNGSLIISASNHSLSDVSSSTFVNLFDFSNKLILFDQMYREFERAYVPYQKSKCAIVKGNRIAPGVKVNPFPPQEEVDEGRRIFLEKVEELKSKYSGKFS